MRTLAIAAKTNRVDVITVLRTLLPSMPLLELKQRLASGRPFMEIDLPLGSEGADTVEEVLSELKAKGIEPVVYTLRSDDEAAPGREVPLAHLENMIESARITRQQTDELIEEELADDEELP